MFILLRAQKNYHVQIRGRLAVKLNCTVSLIGKVEGEERWDYSLTEKEEFSEGDLRMFKQYGLTLLLSPGQAKIMAEGFDLKLSPVVC